MPRWPHPCPQKGVEPTLPVLMHWVEHSATPVLHEANARALHACGPEALLDWGLDGSTDEGHGGLALWLHHGQPELAQRWAERLALDPLQPIGPADPTPRAVVAGMPAATAQVWVRQLIAAQHLRATPKGQLPGWAGLLQAALVLPTAGMAALHAAVSAWAIHQDPHGWSAWTHDRAWQALRDAPLHDATTAWERLMAIPGGPFHADTTGTPAWAQAMQASPVLGRRLGRDRGFRATATQTEVPDAWARWWHAWAHPAQAYPQEIPLIAAADVDEWLRAFPLSRWPTAALGQVVERPLQWLAQRDRCRPIAWVRWRSQGHRHPQAFWRGADSPAFTQQLWTQPALADELTHWLPGMAGAGWLSEAGHAALMSMAAVHARQRAVWEASVWADTAVLRRCREAWFVQMARLTPLARLVQDQGIAGWIEARLTAVALDDAVAEVQGPACSPRRARL